MIPMPIDLAGNPNAPVAPAQCVGGACTPTGPTQASSAVFFASPRQAPSEQCPKSGGRSGGMTTSAAHGSWTASGRIDSSATPREQPIGPSIEHCLKQQSLIRACTLRRPAPSPTTPCTSRTPSPLETPGRVSYQLT